ncbi:MAG: FAD-dependent oxidoreductase [Pseudomonadales bacterium]|nr:FAD-dependent oxidoreductase [Pseudomonadales bacterium]
MEAAPQQDAAKDAGTVDNPVIIIGTGIAGYSLAKEFRKGDKTTPLVLITSDDGRNYSKPMLSTGFTKKSTADDLATSDAAKMGDHLQASVRTMTSVTKIDTDAQTIELDGDTVLPYDKLVLAWGADVIRPPLKGDGLDLVYSINDLMDYGKFRSSIKEAGAKKVLIIGGGLIGSEFSNDLVNGGFEVEAVDPLGYSLPTLLPEVAGKAVQGALEDLGCKFHFGNLVTEVNKSGKGVVATLDNGATIEADIVVCAVGVRPRIELAVSAGIEVNRGIKANRLLETSASNVYTLGDCAEVEGNVLFYVAPLMAGARALGKTLAGSPTEVEYPAMPVTIKTPACPVVVSPAPHGSAGEWDIKEDGANIVARFLSPNGKIIGFALTGEGIREKAALQKLLPPILG